MKSSMPPLDLSKLVDHLRAFAQARDWQQFHTPKNLVMALTGEVGELSELFQWLTTEESQQVMSEPKRAQNVRDELADIVVYCVRLADVLGIDLADAIWKKLAQNAAKYPVELSRGSAAKYTELKSE